MLVRSLGWEDPLEEGMATYSGSLAWRIPWTEEPGGLQATGPQRARHDRSDSAHTQAGSHLRGSRARRKLSLWATVGQEGKSCEDRHFVNC